MILLLTGSRTMTEYGTVEAAINEAIEKHGKPTKIIHGGANGADTLAERYAQLNGYDTHVIKPDYEKYGSKYAPLVRNKELVNTATVVVAVYDGQKTNGTRYTAELAKDQNKPTLEICGTVRMWSKTQNLLF